MTANAVRVFQKPIRIYMDVLILGILQYKYFLLLLLLFLMIGKELTLDSL